MAARVPARKMTLLGMATQRVPLDVPSRPHRHPAEKDLLLASPSPLPLPSSSPTTESSSLRPSTRHLLAYVATPRLRGSLPTAHQTCRKPRTSTTYPHNRPTTVCHPFQMSSQSPSEQHGTPTTLAARVTPPIPMCSRPCLRRDSRTTRPRPRHRDLESTSPPKRRSHPSPVVVKISSRVWCTMAVISHRRRPHQCQTRPARQHTHHTQTCTVAVAHGDVAAMSTNTTMAPHRLVASNPV
jgi:hypothetical protein